MLKNLITETYLQSLLSMWHLSFASFFLGHIFFWDKFFFWDMLLAPNRMQLYSVHETCMHVTKIVQFDLSVVFPAKADEQ